MIRMKKNKNIKKALKQLWWFIWESNSIGSWIVNIILAFVLIKFIVYPSLGFVLLTSYPIVAVVSSSMEHTSGFDDWWGSNKGWYSNQAVTKEEFLSFPLRNGFNKGDIMVLKGKKPADIKEGDVIVFKSKRPDPIIHRVIKTWKEEDIYYFHTKGDNNADSIKNTLLDETKISQEQLIGKAVVRIPLLGYIKIWFVELIQLFMKR